MFFKKIHNFIIKAMCFDVQKVGFPRVPGVWIIALVIVVVTAYATVAFDRKSITTVRGQWRGTVSRNGYEPFPVAAAIVLLADSVQGS